MCFRLNNFALLLLLSLTCLRCLPVIKWTQYPCGYDSPVVYDSALLVEDESIHLSCSVCSHCEPYLEECKKDFSLRNWMKSLRTKVEKPKKLGKTLFSDASNIRERYY